jgi:hypothetical protein
MTEDISLPIKASMNDQEAAERFTSWLEAQVLAAARGDDDQTSEHEPRGKYFLGRLASEAGVAAQATLGERFERMEPCAVGIRLKPDIADFWEFEATATCVAWLRQADGTWRKSERIVCTVPCRVPAKLGVMAFGAGEFALGFEKATGVRVLGAEIRTEVELAQDRQLDLVVQLVNTSPEEDTTLHDTRLYECTLTVSGLRTTPFVLEALPDSFRYDRDVSAYGLNAGVERVGENGFCTVDAPTCSRRRPKYWNSDFPEPDLRFSTLAADPVPQLDILVGSLKAWGERVWSHDKLDARMRDEGWSSAMRDEATACALEFQREIERVTKGIDILRTDANMLRSFKLMNRSIGISAVDKYEGWRAFQVGFLLANLVSVVNPSDDAETVDIVWFATGGGKTETYLGLLVTAAFHDRLRGKASGITAWSRFPLRLLSLQQTQRFANALAAAEIVRRQEAIPGKPFGLGFFVGNSSTPNSVSPDAAKGDLWDPDDEGMPAKAQVLEVCPFCRKPSIKMAFDRVSWCLEHRCTAEGCPWPHRALPVFVVDDEIYRFLPTVVVGTLDKAASIALQASMRGFVGAPLGRCPKPGHGWTYARRSKRPSGCLVPGCNQTPGPLDCDPALFGPSYRLQDELHLLRDSLGAVDSHYEALYDDLQQKLCGARPKILASSATLSGYEKQVDVLYRRRARVFPQPGPSPRDNFWGTPTNALMRRYIAIAPRGVTIEYAVDRLLTIMQSIARRLATDPHEVCTEAGIDPKQADMLLSLYGTDVVYGNTLRDLDAVERSAETQIRVDGPAPNVESLTGRTGFEDVRGILGRLETPEPDFLDRIHVITASSMMSHGVDIDRLNIMIMLGLPLGTAEFIQATARVGRRWPGLVLVVHKIGRERDAAVFRNFEKFVEHGDRFVEAIPITRRSRQVLAHTIAGQELARLLLLHEPQAGYPLTLITALRKYLTANPGSLDDDRDSILDSIAPESLDVGLRSDITAWFESFQRNLRSPPANARFPSDASPSGDPMRSLRDVEETVPVIGSLP